MHDEGEGDGHHGEVGAGDADGRQRQQGADDAGDQTGDDQREPEVHPVQGEDGAGVGADGIEADVADGDLAGEADQDVEADADDGRQRHQRQHEGRVAVAGKRDVEPGGRDREDDGDGGGALERHRYTFFTGARPNSPFGTSARAAITTENMTM